MAKKVLQSSEQQGQQALELISASTPAAPAKEGSLGRMVDLRA